MATIIDSTLPKEHRYEGGRQKVEKYEMSGMDGVFEEIKNFRGHYDDQKRHHDRCKSLPKPHGRLVCVTSCLTDHSLGSGR